LNGKDVGIRKSEFGAKTQQRPTGVLMNIQAGPTFLLWTVAPIYNY